MKPKLLHFVVAVATAFAVAGIFAFVSGLAHEPYSPLTTTAIGVGIGSLVLLVLQSLARNRTVARGSTADAEAARQSAPPEGRATVFIYRDQFLARAVGSAIVIDGTDIGQPRGSTFYRLDLAPVEHRLLSSMANMKDAAQSLTLGAGERAYVRVALKMSMTTTQQQLETVSATAGAAALNRCRLLLPQARPPS